MDGEEEEISAFRVSAGFLLYFAPVMLEMKCSVFYLSIVVSPDNWYVC